MKQRIMGIVAICVLIVSMLTACTDATPAPTTLATPEPTMEGNVVTWNAIENAEGYMVNVDGREIPVADTSYTVILDAPDSVQIKVKAVSGDSRFADGEYSAAVTYTLAAVELEIPLPQVNGTRISWNAVVNAVAYEVTFDSDKVRQTETVYDFADAAVGVHTFSVKALAGSAFFIDSSASETLTVTVDPTQLAVPNLSANGKVFTWTAVTNAVSYEVYVDGVSVGTQTGLSYELEPTEFRVYKVAVKAVSGNEEFTDSEISAEAEYEHVKPALAAPVLTVEDGTVSWTADSSAASYKIYVDDRLLTTVTENSYTFTDAGTYSVQVCAVASDPNAWADSALSVAVTVIIKAPANLSKPFYVYSPHLEERAGSKFVLGIADKDNYALLSDSHKSTLDNHVDNYLCNMAAGSDWTDAQYANYAWLLEEVTDYTGTVGVIPGEKIYRIRLTDGTYLSAAKNNHIGTGGDYLTSSEYFENDIWQYWQFVKVQNGGISDYYIYNVGHSFDWYAHRNNAVTDALTDTTRPDGGAELYPMSQENSAWFVYTVVNVEGAQFAEVKRTDYSGDAVMHNMGTGKLYGFAEGDVDLKQITDYTAQAATGEFVWTLQRVDFEGMSNVYRIRLANGNYLTYGAGYRYKSEALIDDITTPEGQCQLFVINPVHGVKNGFWIGHVYDGKYVDTNDGQVRWYCLDGAGSDVYVSRQWGSLDWKNHISNIWIIDSL